MTGPTPDEVAAQQRAFLAGAKDLSASEEVRAPMHIDVKPLQPNRKMRRSQRNELRAFKGRAARCRDREASDFGIPTPGGRVEQYIAASANIHPRREPLKGLRP